MRSQSTEAATYRHGATAGLSSDLCPKYSVLGGELLWRVVRGFRASHVCACSPGFSSVHARAACSGTHDCSRGVNFSTTIEVTFRGLAAADLMCNQLRAPAGSVLTALTPLSRVHTLHPQVRPRAGRPTRHPAVAAAAALPAGGVLDSQGV